MNSNERALTLENSEELESIYATAAIGGDTSAPANAEDEVDFHYVCFVKSNKSGRIYELDGDRRRAINTGVLLASGDDMLTEGGLRIVTEFMERQMSNGSEFSLLALVLD